MSHQIWKERLHLFSPCAHLCAMATLRPAPEEGALHVAIHTAVRHNAILHSRIEIDTEGAARFVEDEADRAISLQAFKGDVEALVAQQDRIPFAPDAGDVVRFFFQPSEGCTELVAIAHHVVCDGSSLMLLMRDILLALNRQTVAEQPIRLLTRDDLPKHSGLGLVMRAMLRNTNARWQKSGKAFTFDDERRMFGAYAASHATLLRTRVIDAAHVERLKQEAHRRSVTLNSLLTAVFASVLPDGESIGIAVDVRPEGWTGMGNYAIGISVKPKKGAAESAEDIHLAIRQKLDRPRERYFLHDFMCALSPTLVDSIYFSRYDGYQNPISASVCKMCGYVDSPKGLSLSNLKTLAMPDEPAWTYRYEALSFAPPYIPNVRAVVGVSTYRGSMTFALRTASDERAEEEIAHFEKACDTLTR